MDPWEPCCQWSVANRRLQAPQLVGQMVNKQIQRWGYPNLWKIHLLTHVNPTRQLQLAGCTPHLGFLKRLCPYEAKGYLWVLTMLATTTTTTTAAHPTKPDNDNQKQGHSLQQGWASGKKYFLCFRQYRSKSHGEFSFYDATPWQANRICANRRQADVEIDQLGVWDLVLRAVISRERVAVCNHDRWECRLNFVMNCWPNHRTLKFITLQSGNGRCRQQR